MGGKPHKAGAYSRSREEMPFDADDSTYKTNMQQRIRRSVAEKAHLEGVWQQASFKGPARAGVALVVWCAGLGKDFAKPELCAENITLGRWVASGRGVCVGPQGRKCSTGGLPLRCRA